MAYTQRVNLFSTEDPAAGAAGSFTTGNVRGGTDHEKDGRRKKRSFLETVAVCVLAVVLTAAAVSEESFAAGLPAFGETLNVDGVLKLTDSYDADGAFLARHALDKDRDFFTLIRFFYFSPDAQTVDALDTLEEVVDDGVDEIVSVEEQQQDALYRELLSLRRRIGELEARLAALEGAASGGKSTVNHTGTIRVEGVTDNGMLSGVVDIVIDQLRQEVRL